MGLVRSQSGAVVPRVRARNVQLAPVYTLGSSLSMTRSAVSGPNLGYQADRSPVARLPSPKRGG